jgi:hypothetical protein
MTKLFTIRILTSAGGVAQILQNLTLREAKTVSGKMLKTLPRLWRVEIENQ